MMLKRHRNRVPRRAGQVKRHQTLFAQPSVDQRRFADIRAARHGQLDNRRVFRLDLWLFRQVQRRQRHFDQRAHALTVRGGDRQHLAQAQLKELGELEVLRHTLGLVGRQHRGLAQLAQVFGNVVILRADARTRIDNENHHIGFSHGLAGLLGHFLVNAGCGIGLEAAGVDDDVLVNAERAVAVMTIPRQPGKVGDDGVARLGQPVKNR